MDNHLKYKRYNTLNLVHNMLKKCSFLPQYPQGVAFSTEGGRFCTACEGFLFRLALPGVAKEFLYRSIEGGIEFHHLLDFLAGVHHRRMIPTPKLHADLRRRILRHFAYDKHRHLAREGDIFAPFLAL